MFAISNLLTLLFNSYCAPHSHLLVRSLPSCMCHAVFVLLWTGNPQEPSETHLWDKGAQSHFSSYQIIHSQIQCWVAFLPSWQKLCAHISTLLVHWDVARHPLDSFVTIAFGFSFSSNSSHCASWVADLLLPRGIMDHIEAYPSRAACSTVPSRSLSHFQSDNLSSKPNASLKPKLCWNSHNTIVAFSM